MHLRINITHKCLQSQSVSVLSSFKCRSVMVVFKKTWRNNISFKKETEKIVLLQVKGLIQIIVKFRTEKYLCTFLSSNTNILLVGTHQLNIVHQILCSSTLKRNELKVYISLKESKLACFTNSYGSLQVHDLVRAEKSIRGYMFLHCLWWCMHVQKVKVSTKKASKKLCARISNSFNP